LFKQFLPNADLGARGLVFHDTLNEAGSEAIVDENFNATISQNLATFKH